VTLIDAAKKLYGMSQVPFFDLSKTDLIFSFGGDPFEKWRLAAKENATWVTFSPYCFSNLSGADEWVAIRPGSEALVAGALANLITEILGKDAEDTIPAVDVVLAAQTAGLKVATLRRFATMFAYSSRKVAIPGAAVLGQTGGLAAAEAVLALNGVVGNLGTEGGLFLKPEILASQARMKRPSTFAEVKSLIERIRSGQVKALFLHGVDPLNELPPHMGLEKALDKLEVMFSFAPSIDRTAHRADYILPDRATIESWGYNRLPPVSDRPGLSIWRPLASRGEENRAAVDVLLAAAQASGGELIDAAAYKNEADFVQKSCLAQVGLGDRTSADFEHWSYRGGWWPQEQLVMPPVSVGSVSYDGISPGLGDKKGNDTAILMSPYVSYEQGGNQFVALNSLTARRLNLCEGQTVLVESAFGQIIVDVKLLDDILDGVAVVPLSLQRASKPNAWRLLGELENVSGNLAYCQLPITIT
jgi:anaerobic selenocysteine-containing dehydrogenase